MVHMRNEAKALITHAKTPAQKITAKKQARITLTRIKIIKRQVTTDKQQLMRFIQSKKKKKKTKKKKKEENQHAAGENAAEGTAEETKVEMEQQEEKFQAALTEGNEIHETLAGRSSLFTLSEYEELEDEYNQLEEEAAREQKEEDEDLEDECNQLEEEVTREQKEEEEVLEDEYNQLEEEATREQKEEEEKQRIRDGESLYKSGLDASRGNNWEEAKEFWIKSEKYGNEKAKAALLKLNRLPKSSENIMPQPARPLLSSFLMFLVVVACVVLVCVDLLMEEEPAIIVWAKHFKEKIITWVGWEI